MDIKEIYAYLAAPMEEVTRLMKERLGSDIALLDAVNPSLLEQGGKRLRPILALLVAGAFGPIGEDAVRVAAASELLHNATLLHDDVVDGSDERRGKPTVRSILNGPASVLIGDFWLVQGVQSILSLSRYSERIVRIFAKTLSDLAEGEMLQLQKTERCDTLEEDYFRIIYSKTASLFEAAAVSAAISAGATGAESASAGRYARNLGMAFQIRDDMLDYSGDESLGKPVGIDILEQKITMPLLGALSAVSAEEGEEVREMIRRIPGEPALAGDVRAFVRDHGGMEAAAKVLSRFTEDAILSLSSLPESREKSYLALLARYVGERNL